MGRSASSDDDGTPHDPHGFDLPPERLSSGGRRQPASVVVVVAAALALLIWQPWGGVETIVGPTGSPASTSRAIATAPPGPSPTVDAGTLAAAVYTSITDNEWTVVALLAPPASTEEPATQHAPGWSPTGPFLVLQQGLIPLAAAPTRPADQRAVCAAKDVPRERRAVPLPAGRVVYLGVTVPGSVPRATVTASLVGAAPDAMRRAVAPVILLAGRDAGRRYIIPSTGPGGAILFALTSLAPLPDGTYRFDVASPGSLGHVYLYACVSP